MEWVWLKSKQKKSDLLISLYIRLLNNLLKYSWGFKLFALYLNARDVLKHADPFNM